MIDNKYIINIVNTKNKINRKDVFFMCKERKKAFELIESLNESALKVVNGLMFEALKNEANRVDTPEERMCELKKAKKRQKAKERRKLETARVYAQTCEKCVDALRSETFQSENMLPETLEFMCGYAYALKEYIVNHPSKVIEVIEIIHTNGVYSGKIKKAATPTTKQGKPLF